MKRKKVIPLAIAGALLIALILYFMNQPEQHEYGKPFVIKIPSEVPDPQ